MADTNEDEERVNETINERGRLFEVFIKGETGENQKILQLILLKVKEIMDIAHVDILTPHNLTAAVEAEDGFTVISISEPDRDPNGKAFSRRIKISVRRKNCDAFFEGDIAFLKNDDNNRSHTALMANAWQIDWNDLLHMQLDYDHWRFYSSDKKPLEERVSPFELIQMLMSETDGTFVAPYDALYGGLDKFSLIREYHGEKGVDSIIDASQGRIATVLRTTGKTAEIEVVDVDYEYGMAKNFFRSKVRRLDTFELANQLYAKRSPKEPGD